MLLYVPTVLFFMNSHWLFFISIICLCAAVRQIISFFSAQKTALFFSCHETNRIEFVLSVQDKGRENNFIFTAVNPAFFDVQTSNLHEIIIDNESKICYIIMAVKKRCGLSPFFYCRIKYSEVYRSGHNGPDSKSLVSLAVSSS